MEFINDLPRGDKSLWAWGLGADAADDDADRHLLLINAAEAAREHASFLRGVAYGVLFSIPCWVAILSVALIAF